MEETPLNKPKRKSFSKVVNILFLVVFLLNAITEPFVHPKDPMPGIIFFALLSIIPAFNLFAPRSIKKYGPVVWILALATALGVLFKIFE